MAYECLEPSCCNSRKDCTPKAASRCLVVDDPEHLSAWCLNIKERCIRVNDPLEPECQRLLPQLLRILRFQFEPCSSLCLLIRERICSEFDAHPGTIGKFDSVHRLR